MTIFGFNTDVKQGEITYHVQSEARQQDLLLQTLVFVKGQCVGKHTVSYAEQVSRPEFSTEAIHELLKSQHKNVLEAVQLGKVESVRGLDNEVQDVGGSGLSLGWNRLDSDDENTLLFVFLVSDFGKPAAGAKVMVRGVIPADGTDLAGGTVWDTGSVQVSIPLSEAVISRGAVMVQATYQGKSVTRKLRLKR